MTSNLHLVIKLFRRYLHQQWDKKTSNKKRSGDAGSGAGDESKKPRLETLPDTSNTGGHVTSRTSGLSFSHGPGQSGQSPSSGSGHVYPGTSRQSDNRFANQQWSVKNYGDVLKIYRSSDIICVMSVLKFVKYSELAGFLSPTAVPRKIQYTKYL